MKKVEILSLHLGYGGVEKSIIALANMLSYRYDVTIICSYKLYEEPCFDLRKNIKIKYLINTDLPHKVSDYKIMLKKFRFKSLIKRLNKDYFSNNQYKQFISDSFNGLGMYYQRYSTMKNHLKSSTADIIISTRFIFNEWLGEFASNNIIKIGWEHNHYHNNMKYAYKVIDSCKNLDYLVLVSNSLKEFYSNELKLTKCRTLYIPNVIDEMPSKTSKLNSKKLVSVGRLSEEKGYIDLLKIFKEINKKEPEWTLDIIGDGAEKEGLTAYINKNKLNDKVTLHGFRNRKYINKVFLNSSIFLMTSHTESFGIVLIEAMSHGLPCIAFTSAEGAREIITSGKNGYLIKNRNKEAFEKKCLDLINDEKTRKKIGKIARKEVSKYSSDIVKEQWYKLLEK